MSIRVTSSTDLRKHLSRMMDEVNEDHVPYIVTRSGGKPVVMMSLDDYNAKNETDYLLASPVNEKALMEAIDRLDKGEGIEFELLEDE